MRGLSRDRSPGLWQEVVFRALPHRPQSSDALESSAHRPPLGGDRLQPVSDVVKPLSGLGSTSPRGQCGVSQSGLILTAGSLLGIPAKKPSFGVCGVAQTEVQRQGEGEQDSGPFLGPLVGAVDQGLAAVSAAPEWYFPAGSCSLGQWQSAPSWGGPGWVRPPSNCGFLGCPAEPVHVIISAVGV